MTTPCNTNPTSGCTDNTDAVQLKITTNKLTIKLNDLEVAVDGLALAFANCCSTTGINLNLILDRLNTILTNNTICCDGINFKLDIAWGKLKDIAENVVICDVNTTTEEPFITTTTAAGFPCLLEGIVECFEEVPTTTEEEAVATTTAEEPGTTSTTTENLCLLEGIIECDVEQPN